MFPSNYSQYDLMASYTLVDASRELRAHVWIWRCYQMVSRLHNVEAFAKLKTLFGLCAG